MRRSFLTAAAIAGLPLAFGAVAPVARAQTMPSSAISGAHAGSPARHDRMLAIQAKFAAANTTHDGRLTLAQAEAGNLPMIVANFQSIDVAHRGYVTFNDVLAWRMDVLAARLHQRAQALRAQD